MHTNIHSIKILFVFVLTIFAVPVFAQADYVYNGRHFDSFEKMQSYIVAYMEAWREVYGEHDVDPQSSAAVPRVRNKLTIETAFVRDVAYDNARLVGNIDLKKSERARVWFDYGLTPNNLRIRSKTEVIGEFYGIDRFDQKIINLLPETTYYYRAGAINEDGVVEYGSVKQFTTAVDTQHSDALVEARTSYPRDIDDTHAALRGLVDFNKQAQAYAWFIYGDDENDLYKKTAVQKIYKGNDRYANAVIQGLDENQKYYFRLVAMDIYGEVSYGDIRSFTTRRGKEDEAPKLQTTRAIDITSNSATLTGSVDMNDFRDGVVFFIYGEDRDRIEEVKDDYDEYSDIRERGDDRQKVLLDTNLDRYKKYTATVSYLDAYTNYYFAIGVAYENEDNDEIITLGRTYSLRTKRDNS